MIFKDWMKVTPSLLKSGHRLPNSAVHSDFLGARGVLDEEGDKACKIHVDDRNTFLNISSIGFVQHVLTSMLYLRAQQRMRIFVSYRVRAK